MAVLKILFFFNAKISAHVTEVFPTPLVAPAMTILGIRITSYNVCYTKLLRLSANNVLIAILIISGPPHSPACMVTFKPDSLA